MLMQQKMCPSGHCVCFKQKYFSMKAIKVVMMKDFFQAGLKKIPPFFLGLIK